MPVTKLCLPAVLLSLLWFGTGCSHELKGRIKSGEILTMRRYTVAGTTPANNERWIAQSSLALAGNSSAIPPVIAWLDTFEPASGPYTFDPAVRIDFLTDKYSDNYGIYLNKKHDRCYMSNPAVSGASTGIYKCDPKAFAEVDRLLLDVPDLPMPEGITDEK